MNSLTYIVFSCEASPPRVLVWAVAPSLTVRARGNDTVSCAHVKSLCAAHTPEGASLLTVFLPKFK